MGEGQWFIFECDIPECKREERLKELPSYANSHRTERFAPHGWGWRRFNKYPKILCPGHLNEWERISHAVMRVLFRDAKEKSP